MEKPTVVKELENKGKNKKKPKEKKVLITFQVESNLRNQANKKASQTSIGLSEFLRKCTIAFVNHKDIVKQTDRLLTQTVESALK